MFDWAGFERAGIEAALGAVDRGVDLITARAKEKAPVRRVFKGQDEAVRYKVKSIREIEADRGIRRRLGLGPEGTHLFPPSKVVRRAPQLLHLRTLPVNVSSLSRRGRYELASGRSIHEGKLGGRLRSEIHGEKAKIEGNRIRGRVVSPTPYAKYMEFGTRHNAAHSYLRPAAHESVGEIQTDIARSVAHAARAAARGRRTTITAKLKMRLA